MKKTFIMAFVLAAVVGLAFAGSAFAQDGNPPLDREKGSRGDAGLLTDYISEAMADALGVTVADLETAQENGKMRELIEAQGLTSEEMKVVMEDVRAAALEAAIADGDITQEQVDEMQAREGKRGERVALEDNDARGEDAPQPEGSRGSRGRKK
ncbi:MAG: hypothetical protein HN392_03615 [Anaerolineae bacterium]|jgi:hypothetical protein|nr:hypothetical protein [Anaerolineae bacterium]MBT7783423.1 hypothetical protein [Anaerolineae bacterium]